MNELGGSKVRSENVQSTNSEKTSLPNFYFAYAEQISLTKTQFNVLGVCQTIHKNAELNSIKL